jgi:hypothetical protein
VAANRRDIEEMNVNILNDEYDIIESGYIYANIIQQSNGYLVLGWYNERGSMLRYALAVDVETKDGTLRCIVETFEKHLTAKQAFEELVEYDEFENDNE